jgi:SHS2 domain-containing protein
MSYKYVEDITRADVAFVAKGKTLDEMFESAGLAVTNTMVEDLKAVKPKIKKEIRLNAGTIDKLLLDFLQEFVFWKDKSLLLFSKVNVSVKEPAIGKNPFSLVATLSGDKIDIKRHEMLTDIKAVTMHMFEVKKEKGYWSCRVVLDV